MKIDNKTILSALKADLKSAELLKKEIDARIDTWVREDNGELYGNEIKGKSQIVSMDIKRQREWQNPNLVDPFVSSSKIIKAMPVTFEDGLAARQNELLLNTQFCRQFDRYNFVTKLVKVLTMEGTAVIQTGWDYEDKEVEREVEVVKMDEYGNEYVATEVVKDIKVLKNKPSAKVCRNKDIYVDPTCMDNMEGAQFVIYRYETDLSTLRQDVRYKNLDKVAKAADNSDSDYTAQDKTGFTFKDDARKKLVVYEYWGNYDVNDDGIAEAIVCAWVGNTIIRLQSNPYPDQKHPFIVVPFSSVPFQLHGESSAELLSDSQKIKTAVLRGLIDNMAQSNNGQVGVKKGALDTINRKKFVSGSNFEFNGTPNDFWFGSYNVLPNSAFDVLGLMNNEIESLTGVKGFSGGISGNSLGGTATGARGALDATATRRLNLVRNISENAIKPLIRKWMAYNSEFLSEEEVIRVTNEEFVPIKRDDLLGNIDIDIEISTAEDNAAKSQELSFLLQTVGPNEDPAVRREIMADIMELMRMPDKAQKIRSYQPEPDPAQEKMRELEMAKLELENKLLEANIADKYARAKENEIDANLKTQKVNVEAAKARKLVSEADKLDLDFLKADEGIGAYEEMQKADGKHANAMEAKSMELESVERREAMKAELKAALEKDKHELAILSKNLDYRAKMAALQIKHNN